ncbi:uncharacterized protein LOC128663800 [Bombina bombina]|uniref:uncharacterized protein LOC128663800 n=1 Tax=Bombina bombina TaxID=8345 RepID=UPI00235AADB2|nr:uncharacterized protein LOC128663800 [Bombina bombina]
MKTQSHKKILVILHGQKSRVVFLSVAFPCFVHAASFPPGASRTACLRRAFWIWVDKSFFGLQEWHLEAFNETGYPVVIDESVSAQCGYTIGHDIYGNVEIRISFLGCWVNNVADQRFALMVTFQVGDPAGEIVSYPVSVACRLDNPWNLREIICEENYMEVSVRRIVPWISDELLLGDLQMGWPVTQDVTWQVEIQLVDRTMLTISALEAFNKGYGLNATATRVVFRAPYNQSEARIITISGYHTEVILARMVYTQPLIILIVDTSTACPKDPPVFTTSSLSWMTPAVLFPLVADPLSFKDRGILMGVDGILTSSSVISQNGYTFQRNATSIQVSIPYGAPGGFTESDIVDNTYGSRYTINLMLQREWRGVTADITRHTAVKRIVTPFRPLSLMFLDNTLRKNRFLDVSLGNFFSDVDLKSFVIHNVPLTLDQAKRRGFQVIKVPNTNGTSKFVLQVPFDDPLVEQEYLYDNKRQYTLYVTYVLTLLTKNKDFTYTDVVKCDSDDVVLPRYNGFCTNNSLGIDMTRGNLDIFWIPYIRNIPLTDTLAKSQNYIVYERNSIFHLEIPLFAAGLIYEDVTLSSISVRLNFTLQDNKTLGVNSNFSVACSFPTSRLLICLPNGIMKAIVVGSNTNPKFDPRKTHLRDPTCTPEKADVDRALFSFSVSTCGTSRQFSGDYLVYENEITYEREFLPPVQAVISRDSSFRLTLRCRFPIKDIIWLHGKYNGTNYYQNKGLVQVLESGGTRVHRKRARNTQAVELKVAKDETFSSFYTSEEFPVTIPRTQRLSFQADVPNWQLMFHPVLKECWATSTPVMEKSPQWDLIVDGCAKTGKNYSTNIPLVQDDNIPRFQVTFEGDVGKQLYIHCRLFLCNPVKEPDMCRQMCEQSKHGMGRRSVPMDRSFEVLTVGPIQIVAQEKSVQYQHIDERWHAWTWILSLGLAVIAALTVGSVILAVRLFIL